MTILCNYRMDISLVWFSHCYIPDGKNHCTVHCSITHAHWGVHDACSLPVDQTNPHCSNDVKKSLQQNPLNTCSVYCLWLTIIVGAISQVEWIFFYFFGLDISVKFLRLSCKNSNIQHVVLESHDFQHSVIDHIEWNNTITNNDLSVWMLTLSYRAGVPKR